MRTSFAPSILYLAGGVVAMVTACSDSGEPITPSPTESNPHALSIGMVLSLSGSAKAIGEESKRGAEVAVAQLNALGGVLNQQIELVVENDNSDPRITREKILDLKERGITLGIGPSTSAEAFEIKDLIASDQIVFISPSATSRVLDALTEGSASVVQPGQPPPRPVFFRTAATDIFLSAALASYASIGDDGISRRCPSIVLVQQSDQYGAPIGNAIDAYYKRFSLSVKKKLELDPNVDNVTKLDGAAESSGGTLDADCQLVVAQPEVAGAYMRAFKRYRELNGTKRDWARFLTIGSDGFRQNEFLAAGRSDPADTASPTAGEGSYAIAAETQPDGPEYNGFLNLFKARFPKEDPGRYGSTAYDATILLAAAIERAQSATDHKKIRDTLYRIAQGRVSVRPNRLSDMFDLIRRGEDINYEGASGPLDFTPTGAVQSDFVVSKIEDGAFVQIKRILASQLSTVKVD